MIKKTNQFKRRRPKESEMVAAAKLARSVSRFLSDLFNSRIKQ